MCGIALVMLSGGGGGGGGAPEVSMLHWPFTSPFLYPHFPTFINSNSGGKRGTIALSWKWDPKIESVILVLFSFSRKARKDYGIMAGHGKRPLTPLLYWLGLVHHVTHASSTSLPPPGEDLPTHDLFLPYGWIETEFNGGRSIQILYLSTSSNTTL